MRRLRLPVRCLAVLGLLATLAHADEPALRRFELSLSAGVVAPAQRQLRVNKDDTVRLHVLGDQAGELHLHAYQQKAVLVPGVPQDLEFKAHASGRFRLEWHPAATKGQPAGGHAHAPLAVLEVHPR